MANVSDIVKQFYKNFYGVDPDSATLLNYTTKIERGQMNFNGLILEFYNSEKFKPHFEQVFRLHKAALLREPVYDGIQTVLNEMRKPTFDIYNLADIYASSQEFKNKYGDASNYDQFVEKLYNNVLGRPSNPLEKAGWVNALSAGKMTIGQVLVGFSESPENIAKQEDSLNAYWTTAFINNADPNASGNFQILQQYLDMKKLFDLDDAGSGQYSKEQLINTAIQDNLERFNADNPGTFITSAYFIDTIEDPVSASLQNVIDSTALSKDTYSPKIVSTIPIDDSIGNPMDGPLALVFSDNMAIGSGNIYIKQSSNNLTIETINVAGKQVFLKDNYIIIYPSKKLSMNTDYYINIDSTALKSSSGHPFPGISDTTTFNFTVSPQSDKGAGGGTDKDDNIKGTSGNDYIDGYLGNDTIFGYDGNDTIYGGDGNDSIDGGAGDDMIYGGYGNDTIMASSGTDIIDGGEGIDTFLGSASNDFMSLSGLTNIEMVDGGAGDDIYTNVSTNIIINDSAGNDTIQGTSGNDIFNIANLKGIEYINGASGDDIFNMDITKTSAIKYIDGGAGTDILNGTYENDVIKLDTPGALIINIEIIDAGPGDDIIEGGPGAETIIGGHGKDDLTGWGGADTFYFRKGDSNYSEEATGSDIVRNFVTHEDKFSFEGGTIGSSAKDGALPAFVLDWTDKDKDGNVDEGEENYRYQILANQNYAELQIDSVGVSYDDRADAYTLAASIMQGNFVGGTGKDCDYVLVAVDKSATINVFQPEFWLFWDWNNDNVPDMAIQLAGLQWLYQFDGNDIVAGLGL